MVETGAVYILVEHYDSPLLVLVFVYGLFDYISVSSTVVVVLSLIHIFL